MRIFLCLLPLLSLFAYAVDKPTQSPHRKGPTGLTGWTLSWSLPDPNEGRADFTLVIARGGYVVRRIEGGPTIWKWMFLPDGKRVALEEGPLHFSASCVLVDIASGKKLAEYDCYHNLLGEAAPTWAKALEAVN